MPLTLRAKRIREETVPHFAGLRTPDSARKFAFSILIFAFAVAPATAQQLGQQEIPTPLSARSISPHFEHLTIEDGLSQSTIHNIFQDSRGFMWFTTQDGLNRYDGLEVKTFTHEPFDDSSLGAGFSVGMDEAADGALWVGNANGLYRLDPLTEKFTYYRHDDKDSTSLSGDFVWAVKFDSEGKLWAATNNGLSVMDPDNPGVFQRFHHDPKDEHSLSDNRVYSVFEDSSGTIWIGTANGVSITDRQHPGSFDHVLSEDAEHPARGMGFYDNESYGFLERPEEPGVLWLGTANGIVRIRADTRETERFVMHPEDKSAGGPNTTWKLAQDPVNPSILWVPTWGGGLGRFDVRAKRFVVYHADKDNPNSLLTDSNISVFTDRSGIVWVGSQDQGVSRFNPASVTFAYYRASDRPDGAHLPGSSVWGIFESRDGILWAGSVDKANNNWLTAMDRSAGTAKQYEHRSGDESSLDPGTHNAVFEDSGGRLWVGTDMGVDLLDRSTGRVRHFRADRNDPHAIPGGTRSFAEDRSGTVWFGATRGLAKMRPDVFGKFDTYVNDPSDSTSVSSGVLSIIEDLAGFLWLGTYSGLNRFDPESGKATHYKHDPNDPTSLSARQVNVVVERRRESGVIWAGTAGGGLSRLDVRSGKFQRFTERDGLANNVIYGMLEDDLGRLWITTNHGLSRFDPETKAFKTYGVEIGLQGLEFDQFAYHKSRSGEMFIGGPNGLNAFFPNELSDNLNAPEVQLVDLKLFNKSVKETGAVKLDKPLADTKEIHLDYSQKDVTFDFVAFHYANPSGNQYAYKLDGFNDDWVYVGGKRTASFTNLAPGEYTFHVKAANSDGVWNETGASIHVVVEPPFWATWWFRLLVLVGFVGLLYGGYTARVRQIEDRARKLEGEVEKRTAELKESNDQLEQSHTIVEAINQETSFRRLLTKILEESRVIPGVEKSTALVRQSDDLFHVSASSGWDVAEMEHIRLTPKQAHQRYVEQAEEVGKNIFVAKNVAERVGTEEMADFGKVASFLVLRVVVDGDVRAYLVFDNLTDSDAFEKGDVALLERLREHIQSAFIKTSILEDLQATLDNLRSTQDRLIQSEKMASLGQLTAGIAHEIKNPLNFVNNFSEVTAELANELAAEIAELKKDLPADKAAEVEGLLHSLQMNAAKIGEHGKRADSIVKNMLEHSKVGEGERASIDLNELLDEYVTLAVHGLEARNPGLEVHVERSYDEAVGQVDVVPQDIGRVFMNLLSNAFDVLKEHGANKGAPTVYVYSLRRDNHVEIRVRDNGPGIPDKVKARVFEPFFTTKPTGSGTGLGLSMSYDIVTKGHGGTLDVESAEGEGSTFTVRLPV